MFFRLHNTPTLDTERLRTPSHQRFYAGVALVQWVATSVIALLASGATPPHWATVGDLGLSVFVYGLLMADDGHDRRRLVLQTALWACVVCGVMEVAWHDLYQPGIFLNQASYSVHVKRFLLQGLGWSGVALVSLWWHVAAFRSRSWCLTPTATFVAFWSTTLLLLVTPLVVGLGQGCLALLLGIMGHVTPDWQRVLPDSLRTVLANAVSPGLYAASFWFLKAYPSWLNATLRGLVRLARTLLVPWTMLTLGWGLIGWSKGLPLGMTLMVVVVWWCLLYGALPPGDGYTKRPHAYRVVVNVGWVSALAMLAAVLVKTFEHHAVPYACWGVSILALWALLVTWRAWQRPCWSEQAVFSGAQSLGLVGLLMLLWVACTHHHGWMTDDLTLSFSFTTHGSEERSIP